MYILPKDNLRRISTKDSIWYWSMYGIAVFLKSCLFLPFIIFGIIFPITRIIPFSGGVGIASIIGIFGIIDLTYTIGAPWLGGEGDFPVYMEYWDKWGRYKYFHQPRRKSNEIRP